MAELVEGEVKIMVLRNDMETKEEKLLFQLFFLKNDEHQGIEVVEVEKIDFTEVIKRIVQEESVFITRRRKQKLNPYLIASEEATEPWYF
ncbi:hypothetical protein GWN65_02800, partial [Candidatus Bathyarchaeota archaeon]|nr:hypothetical protein [Candidatus Bathyarchaeota archaeon]